MAEQVITTWQFFDQGFKAGEKCIYIADQNAAKQLASEFVKNSDTIDKHLISGQLVLFDNNIYLYGGFLDISKMQKMINDAERQAISEGYKGLRISGGLPFVAGKPLGSNIICDYEAKIEDQLFLGKQVKALCHYDEKRYEHEALVKVIKNHKKIVIYGKIYENRPLGTSESETYTDIINRLIEVGNSV